MLKTELLINKKESFDDKSNSSRYLLKFLMFFWVSLFFSGCTPLLKTAPYNFSEIPPSQGIVIGSCAIKVQNASGWWPGLSLTDSEWDVEIRDAEENFFLRLFPSRGHSIRVKADRAVNFITLLPAGKYRFSGMQKRGWGNAAGSIPAYFNVIPGQTTYIGRLVITIPSNLRFTGRGKIDFAVKDLQDYDISALNAKYKELVKNVKKSLILLR